MERFGDRIGGILTALAKVLVACSGVFWSQVCDRSGKRRDGKLDLCLKMSQDCLE